MKKSTLPKWLKVVLAGCGLCGLMIYFHFIPAVGRELTGMLPEYTHCFWLWLIFLWLTGIPCFGVLVLGWQIAGTMQHDNEFTETNSKRFCWIARLMVGDAIFLVCGTVLYWLLGMAHPSMVILSIGCGFAGGAIAIAAKVLAILTSKAAALQEQSDWTI